MPLDDDVRAYLRKVSALTMPAVFKMPVPLMRRAEDALKARLAKRPPVGSVEDTTLDGPCGRLPARVYWPERLGDAGAIGRRIAARDDEDVEAPEAAEGLPKAAAGQQLGS